MTAAPVTVLAFYELRRLGAAGLVTPPLVLLLFGMVAGLSGLLGAEGMQVARLLVAALELGLPLAVGVVAASVTADDPARGLQLALKTSYRTTLARRLGVLVAWASLWASAWSVGLRISGYWGLWVSEPLLLGGLVWAAPLLWFVAAGTALALLLGGRSTSGALLGGLWVLENLSREAFRSREWLRPGFLFATTYAPGADFWLANRLALVGTALLLGFGAWLLASRTESLSRGGVA